MKGKLIPNVVNIKCDPTPLNFWNWNYCLYNKQERMILFSFHKQHGWNVCLCHLKAIICPLWTKRHSSVSVSLSWVLGAFLFLFFTPQTAALISLWIWALSQDMSEPGREEEAKISLVWLLQLSGGISWSRSVCGLEALWWSSEPGRNQPRSLLCCQPR